MNLSNQTNTMKKMNFLITDALNQQIEETMLYLGINGKAEFFRFLALSCAKENGIRSTASAREQQENIITSSNRALTEKEKKILTSLKQGPQVMDTLMEEAGLSVPEISALLIELLLENRVAQAGAYWTLPKNYDIKTI